ncbi:FkbM family methyltransferase [Rickettsiales bacterium]|nr:FkbM family methyltransferase [Rickettsiales bacterium]
MLKKFANRLMVKLGLKKLYFHSTTIPTRNIISRISDVELIKPYLKTDKPTIIDGGAHTGATLATFVNFFPNATIYSFEPNPEIYEILDRNVDILSKVFPNAKLNSYPIGLGSKQDELTFYRYAKRTMSSFYEANLDSDLVKQYIEFMRKKNPNATKKDFILGKQKIPVISIDKFVQDNDIEKIQLLKIDLEGFEIDCLKGAKKTLQENKIDVIFSEFISTEHYLDRKVYFSDYENSLFPYGYRLAGVAHPQYESGRNATAMFDVFFVRDGLTSN